MWENHNRRYDLLNEQRCQDLIESFRAQGRQEFPAIVRRLEGEGDFEYEVICGARRHWTVSWLRRNNYPEFRFLIEVRDLTDEEAFRLSDVENRDKEDITEYERAIDYKHALDLYYRTQKEMAVRLEVSESWLSRFLDLGNLPQEIVDLYADIAEIRLRHGADLKPLLKDSRSRRAVMRRAKELAEQQAQLAGEGRKALAGPVIVRELKEAVRKRPATGPLREYSTAAGKPMMKVSQKGRGGLLVELKPGAEQDELVDAFRKAVEEFYG